MLNSDAAAGVAASAAASDATTAKAVTGTEAAAEVAEAAAPAAASEFETHLMNCKSKKPIKIANCNSLDRQFILTNLQFIL